MADPDDHDPRHMLEEYGLHQITAGNMDDGSPEVDGDLIVWQSTQGSPTTSYILATDLASGKLLPVGAEEHQLQTRGHLANGRVVFTKEPLEGAPDYGIRGAHMMLWSAATKELRELNVGLDGAQEGFAFDGTWVVFGNRGSANVTENALWAFNVDTGQLVHVYTPYPRGLRPDGNLESLSAYEVEDGVAYYDLRRGIADKTPDNRTVYTSHNSTVYRLDLTTEERDTLYFGELPIVSLEVERGWLAVHADRRALLMDMVGNRTFWQISQSEDEASYPRIAGDWIVFGHNRWEGNAVVLGESAYHIPSRRLFNLIEGNGNIGGIAPQSVGISTNGEIAVFAVMRLTTEIFDSLGEDLYWMELPKAG